VVDLDHFAECIQARYCRIFDASQHAQERYYTPQGRWPADRRRHERDGGEWSPEEPEGMKMWTRRFRGAVYMALSLGAVLARPYQEPFVREDAEGWREKVVGRLGEWRHTGEWSDFTMGEVAYLRRFPVFDFIDEDGGHEGVFGDVGRWLIESTLERIGREPALTECPSRSLPGPRAHWKGGVDEDDDSIWGEEPPSEDLFEGFTSGSRAECEGVLWVVMQTVHMFEFLLESIVDHPTAPSLGRDTDFSPDETLAIHDVTQRTANVVLLGTFRAETVSLPSDPEQGRRLSARLAVHPDPAPKPHGQREFADIPGTLTILYVGGLIPNVLDGSEAPPPPLQFFTYLLRAHFNLRFTPGTFEVSRNTRQQPYRQFKWRAALFANGFDDVPKRTWFRKDKGIERRLLDVTNGTEILEKYDATAESEARVMVCDPRTYDTFEFFQQLGIYEDESDSESATSSGEA
jgi:hypothetical protein